MVGLVVGVEAVMHNVRDAQTIADRQQEVSDGPSCRT
jgi:hypothetical protein